VGQRKRRTSRSFGRRRPVREPYDTVLIVCEGTKTEPLYFRDLRRTYRLSSANIEITPANGSDPMSIVSYAEARVKDFDRVYCVFDRDSHANYLPALQRIAQLPAGIAGRLIAVPSVPCFELWLLLHFRYNTAAIVAVGGRSPGSVAERELARYIPGYKKGAPGVFSIVNANYPTALRNATTLRQHNFDTGADNPDTKVHDLIEYLRQLVDCNNHL
jgi:RloB-like protein